MTELTRMVIDLDRECKRVVSEAQKEATSTIFAAERKGEKILADVQAKSAAMREERFRELKAALEKVELKRERELQKRVESLLLSLSKKRVAEDLAESILKRLASDLD